MRRLLLLGVLLLALAAAQAAAPDMPGAFHLVYEFDSGQRVPHPYRFRVTLTKQHGTFERWENGKPVRQTQFDIKPEDVVALWRVAREKDFFALVGGVPAALLDSASHWVTLNVDGRELTVWSQATGGRSPEALEGLAGEVRWLLNHRLYDWQTAFDIPADPLQPPFPLTVDAMHDEAAEIHLSDPPEAVEAVWGRGGLSPGARRPASFSDAYDPGEPAHSLVSVTYTDGRASEIRVYLQSPAGRVLSGSVQVVSHAGRSLMVGADTPVARLRHALGHPGQDDLQHKRPSGYLVYGRLGFYFFENRLRFVSLVGSLSNASQGLGETAPPDLRISAWHRASRTEVANGILGSSVHLSPHGGYVLQVTRQGQMTRTPFNIQPADLQDLYRLIWRAGVIAAPQNYPPQVPDSPLNILEGDDGLFVWSGQGWCRSDVLGIRGHEAAPGSLTTVLKAIFRLARERARISAPF
ncbi:MAG: hypothetical protein ACYCW6_22845 [Candidatus Xenobia bacterium]